MNNTIPLVLQAASDGKKRASEAKTSLSEDAYALRFAYSHNGEGYVAVFDGCGGLGAKKYSKLSNLTGARLAANISAMVTDRFYLHPGLGFRFDDTDAERLEERIRFVLQGISERFEDRGGFKISGDLSATLPSTASIIASRPFADGRVQCEYLWAGDSRGYMLDQNGICQITEDDLRTNEDAYSNLQNDARLSNELNADKGFIIHEKKLMLHAPVLLITATDGCFGYLRTPMHFENLILRAFAYSSNETAWSGNLQKELEAVAGDDCAICVTAYGFENFTQCKEYLKPLYDKHRQYYINPLEREESDAKEAIARAKWEEFKPQYYRERTQKRR